MTVEMPLLKSKLSFPKLSNSIQRGALCQTIPDKRLTIVTAGAGYGKTTLVSQALNGMADPAIWYRLDATDRDLSTFLAYLVMGICRICPGFNCDAVTGHLSDSPGHIDGEIRLRLLLVELDACLETDLILVLDDFHKVQDSQAIKNAMNFLMENSTAALHLVLISRVAVSLPVSRLKAQQQLLEIRCDDLLFSRGQTALLCNDILKTKWCPDFLDRIYDLTKGWVSGIVLFYNAFQTNIKQIPQCLEHPYALPDTIADYLEEEVFSQLESNIKDFLLSTAVLKHLDPGFCDEWLGIEESRQILSSLAAHHVLIQKKTVNKSRYGHHPLFRLFFQKKLLAISSGKAIAGLHRKAGILYEDQGKIQDALTHYLAATDFKDAVRLLNTSGRHLFREEKYGMLKAALGKIPHQYYEDYPWVLCLYGKLHGVSGDHWAAAKSYASALGHFVHQGQAEGACLCQIEMALNFYLAGQFLDSAKVLEEILSRPDISDELRIEALGYLTYLSIHLRHKKEWAHYYAMTESVLRKMEGGELDSRLTVWLDIYRGYTYIAVNENEKALEIVRSVEWRVQQGDGLDDFYGHYALASSACYSLHRFKEGLEYACKGLEGFTEETTNMDGAHPTWQPARPNPAGVRDRGGQDTTLPIILLQAAKNAFGLGRIRQTIAYASKSEGLFCSMGVKWCQALGLNLLCTAYARKGDMVLAEQSALSGIGLLKGIDQPLTMGTLMGNLAVVLIKANRSKEALPLIRNAENAFKPIGLSHWIDLWLSMYHWHRDRDQGRAQFLSALQFYNRTQNFCIVAERHWIVPYLADTYARGHLRDYIFNVLQKTGSDAILDLKQLLRGTCSAALKTAASGLLRDLPKPDPPGLKIALLGRFHVFAGDRKIGAEKWGNRKIRSLFQYLAYFRARGYVNRDVLIEMLWPDQDPAKTKNRFHVTMTTLRRVLEPDLPDGAPSSYISRVGDTYRIDLGKTGWVDAHGFGDKVTLANREKDPQKAAGYCMEAAAAYTGDLLAEAPFCQWCRDIRQDLRNQYLNILQTIIHHFEMLGEFENCIVYTQKYLGVDRTDEKMVRALMGFYARTGNLVQVASTLRRCRENLRLELDCPVEPETLDLAGQLLADKIPGDV
ncbi:MAG: BTAD domain-containing putative transcriptional regulator [Desulfobacterium sp.]